MKLCGMLPFRGAALCALSLLITMTRAGYGDGLYNTYCSNENTGSSYPVDHNIYNSMGSCTTLCQDDYAFAILQWQNCWCSDYIPADQVSTSECDEPCPGYTSDLCGNQERGLFGYVALAKAPYGTAGAATSTKTTPIVQTTRTTTTIATTSTPPPPAPTTSESPSSTYVAPQSSSTASSSDPSSTSSAAAAASSASTTSAMTTVHTTTINGAPTTQTVTSTPSVVSQGPSSDQPSIEKKGLSSGAVAGVVLGALIGAAAIILAAVCFWRRRRNADSEQGSTGGRSIRSPRRKGSVLSRTGLLGGARPQSMSEMNYDNPYAAADITRSTSVRNSIMFGAGATGDGVDLAGPLGPSTTGGSGSGTAQDDGIENRHSRPLVYDQRLNPSALFANFDNGSRVSMQDQQDYSRPLGVANPDLRYSFDSR